MEKGDLELGNIDITQKSVQSLLCRVENEDIHTNRFPLPPSIFMVPEVLRELSPGSFNPRVVSIGPLHRKDKNVQAFEGRKVSYLTKLLSRNISVPKEKILESCMHKVYASMEQIKAYYVWTKTSYNDAEIAEMMVMDACFILEFINQLGEPNSESLLQSQLLICDLVLLENQIPFFVLDEIYKYTMLTFHLGISLIQFLEPLLHGVNIFEGKLCTNHIFTNSTTHHILDLLHECYKPKTNICPKASTSLRIPSVVDLDRAGVNFKPKNNPTWPLQMEVELYRSIPCFFGSRSTPTLRMPVLQVHDSTELILRNLIAYEQMCETGNYITSYAIGIDELVDTQEDVAKLVDAGVLVNIMGSNEEAVNMINSICKDISWTGFYYEAEWKTLNDYCNGYWPKHIVKLRRTYFSSPWNIIALLAGIILFTLTLVQTFFTVKSAESNN